MKKFCHKCGKKLKPDKICRDPDNDEIFLCKKCFDKLLDEHSKKSKNNNYQIPSEEKVFK